MSKKKKCFDNYITNDDVGLDPAPVYPGKWTRNNKGGVHISKCDYLENEAKKWVNKVADLPKYQTTSMCVKAELLAKHLKAMKVSFTHAKKLLISAESTIEPDSDNNDEQIEQREEVEQNEQDEQSDMEVDEQSDDDLEIDNRHLKESEIDKALQQSDEDLFADEEEVSSTVKESFKYKERKKQYATKYIDQSSSQDLLTQFSQVPKVIQESDEFKSRLSHLT